MSGWVSDAEVSASGASFPSLDNIYEEEEDSFISLKHDRTKATCVSSAEVKQNLDPDQTPRANRNVVADLYAQAELCRPSDDDIHEVTQSDVTQPTENRRHNRFLQLVKVCFSKDMTSPCVPAESNLVASNTAAAAPDASNNEESSFLDTTDVVDLPTTHFRLGISENIMNNDTDDDSTYNLHASTLSRASASTKTSMSITETIFQESKIAAEMTRARAAGLAYHLENDAREKEEDSDNQTLSTYSYRRAYVDNITLGSVQTSNYSTITDDYSYETKRRIGMAEAVRPNVGDKRSSPSGPVDMDTGNPVAVAKDEESAASYPSPPPIFRTNDASNFNLYESHENLHRIVSFGEGEGYVDEEAAERFAPLRRGRNGSSGCCSWFSSAPREVKVMIVGSILMLLVSVVSVSIGLLLQQNRNGDAAGFVASSNSIADGGVTEDIVEAVISPVPSSAPSATLKPFDTSFSPTPMPSKRPSTPLTSVVSTPTPSQRPEQPPPSRFPTQKPSRQPSQPPTRSPSQQPTAKPTIRPTPRPTPITLRPSTGNPTRQPTNMPSPKPSSPPSKAPSKRPTQKPTTLAPSKSPTIKPSKSPTQKPTTPVPSSSPTKTPSTQPIVESPTLNPSSSPSRSPTPPPSSLPTTRAPVYAHPSLSYTIKMRAAQDTYIDASSMWENFGTSSRLRVDGSPERRAFIGFDTSHLTNRVARHEKPLGNDEPRKLTEMQVLEATLRLFSVDDGGGGSVYFLPNTKQWDETLVTATSLGNGVNAAGGFQVASFGDVAAYRWQEIDVTEAFTGGARDFTTFAMTSESSDGVSFASRERAAGMLAPELVLTIAGTETLAPSYAPTAILSEDPSPKPSRKPTQKPTPIPTVFDVTTMIPTKEPSSGPTQISTLELTSSPQTKEPTIGTSNGTTPKVIELDLCQTCPTSGTLFVAGSQCLGFWRCADGVRDHYHACPEGTIFNNLLQICDHPYNFTCTCNP
mmetsp:Transcript_12583/g.25072  ORF Transcript_12583/g.25072 Transcript_12583/m.25072 type:complete len:976 (-) Transcript_12583:114-3041(-)